MRQTGIFYGIGVGPGDPELLTLKAYKILNQADVIFCPEKKKGAGSFAFDIIKEHIKDSKAQIVNLEYPMHYKGDELKKMWEEEHLSRWEILLYTALLCTLFLI